MQIYVHKFLGGCDCGKGQAEAKGSSKRPQLGSSECKIYMKETIFVFSWCLCNIPKLLVAQNILVNNRSDCLLMQLLFSELQKGNQASFVHAAYYFWMLFKRPLIVCFRHPFLLYKNNAKVKCLSWDFF